MLKNTLKRLPYYLGIATFVVGASLIIGLLSFSGMYTITPSWPLALGAFALSVAYEGEIYWQNITGAFNKLFLTPEYQKGFLAKEFLKNNFPENKDKREFFKDYEIQLQRLHTFEHKELTSEQKKQKRKIEQQLRYMEKWFADQVFSKHKKEKINDNLTAYAKEIQTWLNNEENSPKVTEIEKTFSSRKKMVYVVGAFSVLSTVFMTMGTTYLLSEAIIALPMLTSLSAALPPVFFIALAGIAGLAYGILTYNAINDMINNKTLQNIWSKLKSRYNEGLTIRNVSMMIFTITLMALATALTICTAGTWWTVAKEAKPMISLLGKLPDLFISIGTSVVLGFSALFFNWENTAETIDLIEQTKKGPLTWIKEGWTTLKEKWALLPQQENWLQILNPARIILKLTVTPLRIVFFLGHLVSIGLTGDRMPKIPEILSALLGIISEGFEDGHYFFGDAHHHHHDHKDDDHDHDHDHNHDDSDNVSELVKERLAHEHGHNHNTDLPTRLIKLIFSPVYLIATVWDWGWSKLNPNSATISGDNINRRKLGFTEALYKQIGLKLDDKKKDSENELQPSISWQKEESIIRIEEYQKEHFSYTIFGKKTAIDKSKKLDTLKTNITSAKDLGTIQEKIKACQHDDLVMRHRHSFFGSKPKEQTATALFLQDLQDSYQVTG